MLRAEAAVPVPNPRPLQQQSSLSFCAQEFQRNRLCASLEVSMYSATQGTNYPRPDGVAHHALRRPSSLPRLTKCPDAHSSEAQGGERKERPLSSASMSLSFQGSADTRGSPHAQTRTQPPLHPSISAQECRGRCSGPACADAAAGLKGKCFLNEIKREACSPALRWCPKNPAQGYGD